LYDFFAQLSFWKMQPFAGVEGDAVALAEPGQNYVVYFPHGGQVTVDLSAARGSLTARWLNPRTGESIAVGGVRAGTARTPFTPPFDGDAVLHVKSTRPAS
jgi:hypothetical protein